MLRRQINLLREQIDPIRVAVKGSAAASNNSAEHLR